MSDKQMDDLISEVTRAVKSGLEATLEDTIKRALKPFAETFIQIGVQRERARLNALLNPQAREETPSGSGLIEPKPEITDHASLFTAHRVPKPATGYGAITNKVRLALKTIGNVADGVGPREVMDWIKARPNTGDVDIAQIRTALKVLGRREEAKRLERGRYVPGPKLADVPSSFTH